MKILFIAPELKKWQSAQVLIEHIGHKFTSAVECGEAINLLKENYGERFDLVIIDWAFRYADRIALIRFIRGSIIGQRVLIVYDTPDSGESRQKRTEIFNDVLFYNVNPYDIFPLNELESRLKSERNQVML